MQTMTKKKAVEKIVRSQQSEAMIGRIDCLDLSMVKMKLCLPVEKEGKGWTTEQADDCEVWYKRFLKLCLIKGNGKDVVPTKLIDQMWHAHILDTRKYQADCQAIFGHYLHHFPYFGLRGEQDAHDLQDAFHDTLNRFELIFGEAPTGFGHSDCDSCGGNQCGQTS